MKTKKELQKEIDHLKQRIKSLKQFRYIHEINDLHASNGELCLSYGPEPDNQRHLVFNAENLFNDLALIVSLTVKESNKMRLMHLEQIKKTLNEIK